MMWPTRGQQFGLSMLSGLLRINSVSKIICKITDGHVISRNAQYPEKPPEPLPARMLLSIEIIDNLAGAAASFLYTGPIFQRE
jgi:hypothetical protein